ARPGAPRRRHPEGRGVRPPPPRRRGEAPREEDPPPPPGAPPVAATAELLAGLEAVPEEPERAADLDGLLAAGEAVEARRGRTGHHALADAVHQRLAERRHREAEEEEARPGPPVRGPVGLELRLDPGLGVATDDRGGA